MIGRVAAADVYACSAGPPASTLRAEAGILKMRAAVLFVFPLLASGFSPSSILLRPASSAGFTAAVRGLPPACPRSARVALTPRCVAVEGGARKVRRWQMFLCPRPDLLQTSWLTTPKLLVPDFASNCSPRLSEQRSPT